jgi:hypothetical protein
MDQLLDERLVRVPDEEARTPCSTRGTGVDSGGMTVLGASGGWAIVVYCVVAFLVIVVGPTVAVLLWRRADRRRTPEEQYQRAIRSPSVLPWHGAAESDNHHNPVSGHHGGHHGGGGHHGASDHGGYGGHHGGGW